MIIPLSILMLCIIAIRSNSISALKNKRYVTERIKFILSLLVVNGHLFLCVGSWPILSNDMSGVGSLCVSIFLFLSGYGLMCSYEHKGGGYLVSFVRKRGAGLLIPLITAYIVSLATYQLLVGDVEWGEVFYTFYWGGPYLKFSWYVTELAVLYLLFFVSMRYFNRKDRGVCYLTFMVLAFILLMIVTNQPIWYIMSTPAFLIGVLFQRYEERICSRFTRIPKLIMYAAVSLLILVLLVTYNWRLVASNIACLSAYRYHYLSYYVVNITAVILMLIALVFIKSPTNYKRFKITECYYEIYLMQNCSMIIAKSLGLLFPMYWVVVMLLTVALAYIIHTINNVILQYLIHK